MNAEQCDVEFVGGGRCTKAAGHRTLVNQDPHTPPRTADEAMPSVGALPMPAGPAPLSGDLLAAENKRLREELAKYVGKEPTIAEEMQYLSDCLHAVHDLCNRVEAFAEQAGQPVPEWVEQVRTAADGTRPNDPADRRHRIYIDGKGNGWISVCSDEGTEWVVPVQAAAHVEQDVRDVADETGSLREIGRCW